MSVQVRTILSFSLRSVLASGQFWWRPKLIRSGAPEKIILLRFFRGFFVCLWNLDNFSYLTEVCHSPDNIAQRNFFCIRKILNWADTDLLGGFRGSYAILERNMDRRL